MALELGILAIVLNDIVFEGAAQPYKPNLIKFNGRTRMGGFQGDQSQTLKAKSV